MKTEKIYINGYIGEVGFFDDVSNSFALTNLNAELDRIGKVDELNVYINSGGGSVTEGFAIYDRLMALDCTVNTIVNGMCGSIATVIFQAGTKGKRMMFENSEFFVHNPFWQPSAPTPMEAKDLALLQEDLQNAENKIKSFYATVTGKSEDDLKPILDRQTTLSATEAIEYGFADEVYKTQISAYTKYRLVAYLNNDKKTEMENKELKAELGGIKGLLNRLISRFKNAYTETVDGTKIYFDGTMVMKDTAVFSDEAMTTPLSDGDYTLDSVIITVVNGIVTELMEAQPVGEAKPDPLAEAQKEIDALKAQLAEKENVVAEKENVINETKVEIVALAKKVTEFEAMLVTGGNFQANGGQSHGKKDTEGQPTETQMERIARLRAEKDAKK